MSVKNKLVFNAHTLELVGYVGGAINNDVISTEFSKFAQGQTEAEIQEENKPTSEKGNDNNQLPVTAEHLLLFIFSTWDRQQPVIKRAVARHAVGAKSTGTELLVKIEQVVCALYTRGFLVNQVCSDGASENVSALSLLANHNAEDVFPSLNPKLPKQIPVAFKHPSRIDEFVFIGGEIPHWIKRVVNSLENSTKSSHKRCITLKWQPLGLGMIKKAWETIELGGIITLRQTKLTIDHFVKNSHSRMQVFLSAQILSASVHQLLLQYVKGDDELKMEYSSLMDIILKLDRLIDIWNHPDSKGCTFIDFPNHQYIAELEEILIIFADWKEETRVAKNPWACFSHEIFNDLCWIVYGLKRVAMFYLDDDQRWGMVQSRGETDDVEHAFSHLRSKNSNPTIMDCNRSLGRNTGVKSTTFSMRAKLNSSGDNVLYISELNQTLLNKRQFKINK